MIQQFHKKILLFLQPGSGCVFMFYQPWFFLRGSEPEPPYLSCKRMRRLDYCRECKKLFSFFFSVQDGHKFLPGDGLLFVEELGQLVQLVPVLGKDL